MSLDETKIPWWGHLKFRIYNSEKNNTIWSAGENGLWRKIRLYQQHGNIHSCGLYSWSKHHHCISLASLTTKVLQFRYYSLELHLFLTMAQWSHTVIFLNCCSLHQHYRHTSSPSGTVFMFSFRFLAPVAIMKLNVSTAHHLITLSTAKKCSIHNIWMSGWMMNGWMDGWMNEWMNEWMDEWMNGRMNMEH
jgi:hypothetical protein